MNRKTVIPALAYFFAAALDSLQHARTLTLRMVSTRDRSRPQRHCSAYDDFRIVRDNLSGGARSTHGRLVPFCMFTDPELGRVGLNESEAQRVGEV